MKMQHLMAISAFIGYGGFSASAGAHHAIASDYNPDEYITIEAVVKEFRFINPHAYVTADVTTTDGKTAEWRLLLDDRWELIEDGFTRSTLQPGDELVVTGMPSLRQSENLYVRSIERPADGFLYVEDEGEEGDSNE